MKRLLTLIFAALCASAHAQTGITVMADSNRVIRTNFSLVRSQVSDLSGASFAISNITGLQTTLDGKLATNGTLAISNITSLQGSLDAKLATNGSAAALTNFPASILQTNSSESAFPQALLRTNGSAAGLSSFPAVVLQTNSSLSAFPQGLLRTNGDGSALTNLPNANLSNAIGVLPLSNGGTGSTNQSSARTALGLGSASTNDASAFQPASTALTNLAAGDASGLTNLPNANLGTATGVLGIANGGSAATNAEGARTNFGLVWSGLTNADAAGFRTALSLGTAATNDATAFQPASANLTNLANNNGGSLTNVSVDLTAVLPSYSNNVGKVLAVAVGATNVEWTALSNTVTDASTLTNFPALILQTNSAETNFPAFLLRTNGNASGLTFPATLLTTNGNGEGLTNLNAANVVGTVALASNVSGTVAIANGGTGAGNAANARINLLPSYTGNELRVLALNSNATDVIWAVDGGGQANLTNVTNTLAVANGGTGATNAASAVSNLGLQPQQGAQLGDQANNGPSKGAAIGYNAVLTNVGVTEGGAAIGDSARASLGLGGGDGAKAHTGVAAGYLANSEGAGGAALGRSAIATSGEGGAVGRQARVTNGFAGGYLANALAATNVQLGIGTNSSNETIQFLSAGTVNTTEWGYLANASAQGGYAMTNTAGISGSKTFVAYDGTNYTTNTVTFSNGLITGWTP